jgi:hypothetical protein
MNEQQSIDTPAPLRAHNPLDWLRLWFWLYCAPSRYQQYVKAYDKPVKVARWLVASLSALAFTPPLLGMLIDPALNATNGHDFEGVALAILVVGWLGIGLLGDREDWVAIAVAGTFAFGVAGAVGGSSVFAWAFAVALVGVVAGAVAVFGEIVLGVAFAIAGAGAVAGAAAFAWVNQDRFRFDFMMAFAAVSAVAGPLGMMVNIAISVAHDDDRAALLLTRAIFALTLALYVGLAWLYLAGGYRALGLDVADLWW